MSNPQKQVSPAVLREVQRMNSFDAAESLRAAGALTEVMTNAYSLKLPALASTQMFDVDNTPDPGLERVENTRVDLIGGVTESGRNGGNSYDRVELMETADGRLVDYYTNVYGFSDEEMERAARRTIPLQATKAQAARYVHAQRANDIVFNGNSHLYGILTDTSIPTINAPKKISAMTGDEILQYVNQWALQATTQSKGRFVIDSIASTPTVLSGIDSILIPNTGVTAGSLLFAPGKKLKNKYESYEMTKGAQDFMLIYAKDPTAGKIRNPMAFRQKPPQYSGTMMDIYCRSATAGFVVTEPGAYLLVKGV